MTNPAHNYIRTYIAVLAFIIKSDQGNLFIEYKALHRHVDCHSNDRSKPQDIA